MWWAKDSIQSLRRTSSNMRKGMACRHVQRQDQDHLTNYLVI